MALVDKVKNQAAQLAQKAQEAGKAGQAKIEELQARRRADGQLRELGVILYTQLKDGGEFQSSSEVGNLVSDLKSFEAEFGPLGDTAQD